MPIVIENLNVQPEAAPATRSTEQTSASSTASQPNAVEVEKTLRQTLERMARIRAS